MKSIPLKDVEIIAIKLCDNDGILIEFSDETDIRAVIKKPIGYCHEMGQFISAFNRHIYNVLTMDKHEFITWFQKLFEKEHYKAKFIIDN